MIKFTVTPEMIGTYNAVKAATRGRYFNFVFIKGYLLIFSNEQDIFKMMIANSDVDGIGSFRLHRETANAIMHLGLTSIEEYTEPVKYSTITNEIVYLAITHYDENMKPDLTSKIIKEKTDDSQFILDIYKKIQDIQSNPEDYKWYKKSIDFDAGEYLLSQMSSSNKLEGIQYADKHCYTRVEGLYTTFDTVEFDQDMVISKKALSALTSYIKQMPKYCITSFGGYYICVIGTSVLGWKQILGINYTFDISTLVPETTFTVSFDKLISTMQEINTVKEFVFSLSDRQAILRTDVGSYTIPLEMEDQELQPTSIAMTYKAFKSIFGKAYTKEKPPVFQLTDKQTLIITDYCGIGLTYICRIVEQTSSSRLSKLKQMDEDDTEGAIIEEDNTAATAFFTGGG